MHLRKSLALLATFGALALATTAYAAPIPLYGTGFDSNGTLLPADGTGTDGNYTLANFTATADTVISGATYSLPALGSSAKVTDLSGVFPSPYWWSDSSDTKSNWISPEANYAGAKQSDGVGYYDWKTSFNIGGFFSGKYWADNSDFGPNAGLVGVYLDGQKINPGPGGAFGSENAGNPFSFTTDAGTDHTLDFVVYNATQTYDVQGNPGNPTGLRVEFDGSPTIPEPAFYQMGVLLAGGGLMAVRLRRKSRA